MNRERALSQALLVAAGFLFWTPQPAAAQFRLPELRGFLEVQPGAAPRTPDRPPRAHPSGLSVKGENYERTGQTATLKMEGRVRADAVTPIGQLLFFESEGSRRPASILIKVPFDLRRLFAPPMEGELRYSSWFAIDTYERTMTLSLTGGHRFQIIQVGGTEPLVLDPGSRDIDMGVSGLVVRQGDADSSASASSHDYTYPVPLEIETADGTVTSLWQGQWVELPGGGEDQVLRVVVLVSEVAKPAGKNAFGVEGAPFNLDLLVVRQAR